MVLRKLMALDYELADSFDIDVLWLEEGIFRVYDIKEQKALKAANSDRWWTAFKKYCEKLNCPISCDERKECLEWLVGRAVKLKYLEKKDEYSRIVEVKTESPIVKSENPLDNYDFQSEDFKVGVNKLAEVMKVTQHPNHLITLEAISTAFSEMKTPNPQGKPFPIMESDLGFDLNDYVVNQAAKVLRLLYIHDLRDLQTKINECIVLAQTITANPKTNTKLGKVGF